MSGTAATLNALFGINLPDRVVQSGFAQQITGCRSQRNKRCCPESGFEKFPPAYFFISGIPGFKFIAMLVAHKRLF
jgi:hypothetical protein